MRSLHRSRLLAFCSITVALSALGLPYSYYLMRGSDGRTHVIDFWGADSFNALCFATLLMPILILALIGPRTEPPRKTLAWLITAVGGMALLLGFGLLVGYALDPRCDVGIGFYVQLLAASLGLAAGITALLRSPRPAADANRP